MTLQETLFDICKRLQLDVDGDIVYMTNPLHPNIMMKIYIDAKHSIFKIAEDQEL